MRRASTTYACWRVAKSSLTVRAACKPPVPSYHFDCWAFDQTKQQMQMADRGPNHLPKKVRSPNLHMTGVDNCQVSGCSTLPFAEQDTFIFNDAIHFTTAFDQGLASSAATIVNADESIQNRGVLIGLG